MIRAVIFDFDGTLSNGEQFDYDNLYEFFRPYSPDLDEREYDAVLQDLNSSSIHACGPQAFRYRCHLYLKKYSLDESVCDALEEYWEKESYKHAVLRENAMEVLKELKKSYKIGICTNGGKERQHNKLYQTGLHDFVDGISISAEVGKAKPAKEMYLDICQKLNVLPEECLYVGDSLSGDCLGAYRVGMIPIWMQRDLDRPTRADILRITDLSEVIAIAKRLEEKES